MEGRNFMEMVRMGWQQQKFMCVGLDPVWEKLPGSETESWSPKHKGIESGLFAFNKAIIDATADIACAFKPNLSFYQRWGDLGIRALEATIHYILGLEPTVPVILDAKYGDIGNTNNGYVDFAFGRPVRYRETVEEGRKLNWSLHGADAVTVHNYMGLEAMRPFLDDPNKGVIVLCKTSNPGSAQLQDIMVRPVRHVATRHLFANRSEAQRAGYRGKFVDSRPMRYYEFVAYVVQQQWNYNHNCGLVVGATYPAHIRKVRSIAKLLPQLIPGVGAQGGDLVKSVLAGADSHGSGFLLNSGSADIFASNGKDFAKAARTAVRKRNNDVLAALAA